MSVSIHKKIERIFIENPRSVYTTGDLTRIFNSRNEQKTEKNIITTILTRLYRSGFIFRTPTQLTDGHYYSMKNKKALSFIYENYLLPYELKDKSALTNLITKKKFEEIKSNYFFRLDKIEHLDFVSKYGFNFFKDKKNQQFLAMLVGFSMCDGYLDKKINKVRFFFRRESDARLFVNDFKMNFSKEEFWIRKNRNGDSYESEIKSGSSFAKFLHTVGTPAGNKVLQPFLIPDWIYHGPGEIKKIFLSTVIGNEGSAPSNNRWRIQFVLSKCKEHVPNLIEFLNQIRAMLFHFGITTSHIQLRKQKGRQFHGRFYIKGKKNLHKFYNKFSLLYASEKQEVLEKLISDDLSQRREKRDELVNTR